MTSLPLGPHGLPIAGTAELQHLLMYVGVSRGMERQAATAVATLLPDPLRGLTCFLNPVSLRWEYFYANPFELEAGMTALAPDDIVPLFEALRIASKWLPPEDLDAIRTRIGDRAKYRDAIAEFAPLLKIPDEAVVVHEKPGLGPGNSTIDWLVTVPDNPPIALEVKHRHVDVIRNMNLIGTGQRSADGGAPEPDHDPSALLRSIEGKFVPQAPGDRLQGAWIQTKLTQDAERFRGAVADLDPSRIHFVILGDWQPDITIFGSGAVKQRVLGVLGRSESSRFLHEGGTAQTQG